MFIKTDYGLLTLGRQQAYFIRCNIKT